MFRKLFDKVGEGDGGGGEGEGGNGADNAAVEAKARGMGWTPKDQWRGNPDNWFDANEYVKRGEQIMPILQANNRKSEAKLAAQEVELQKTKNALQAAQESIAVLTQINTKTTISDAKAKRKELLRRQAQARKDENDELEVEIGEEIADATTAIAQAEEALEEETPVTQGKKGGKQQQQQQTVEAPDPATDPDYQAWLVENPWFKTDMRKAGIATAIGADIKRSPEGKDLKGRAFFDKVSEEVNKLFEPHRRSTGSKVEGGGANGGGGGGGGGGSNDSGSGGDKTFADLPADAKAVCTRQAPQVVGAGRAFKDIKAWQAHYVQKYFEQ